jgi:predicted lactoylglutathione lyase
MEPGNFSVRLAVKDIVASKAVYEEFGFKMRARFWLTSTYEVEGPAG